MYQTLKMTPDYLKKADKLLHRSAGGQWDPDTRLDWDAKMDLQNVHFSAPLISSGLESSWDRLSPASRGEASRLLLGGLLGNLAVGEVFVDESLSALKDLFPHPKLREFLDWHIGDEVRHANVLHRYCDKVGYAGDPERAAAAHLNEATEAARGHWESAALLIMVLEIAATAAIQGIRIYCDEPLTLGLLKGVVQDESRHISGMTLSLRAYTHTFGETERARLKDAAILGWCQGLAVTEAPACANSDYLDGAFGGLGKVHTASWPFFRKTLSDILVPKLRLLGLLDRDLADRLIAVGCPVPDSQVLPAMA